MVDLGSHFGGHWISKGQSGPCFSMFSALSQKTETHMCFLTTIPPKLQNAQGDRAQDCDGVAKVLGIEAHTVEYESVLERAPTAF